MTDRPMRYWIGVASQDHVMKGAEGGFCQLCHGKERQVRRLGPGDWIVYYSPRTEYKGGVPVQAFTAIGQVQPGEAYAFDMGGGFVPWRRDVAFLDAEAAPIRPLIDQLTFIRKKESWGYVFRFGNIEIGREDFETIARAMGVDIDAEVRKAA